MYLLCAFVSEVRLPHFSSWFVLYLSLGLGIRILSVGSDFWLLPHFGFPESFSSKDWVSYPSWSELPHSSIFHFICLRCFPCSLENVNLFSLYCLCYAGTTFATPLLTLSITYELSCKFAPSNFLSCGGLNRAIPSGRDGLFYPLR